MTYSPETRAFWFWLMPVGTVCNLYGALWGCWPSFTPYSIAFAFICTASFIVRLRAGDHDDYGFGRWPGYTGE